MIRKRQGDVEWLEFELLSGFPQLVHGVFLRHGGYSEKPFSSLNVAGGIGDDRKNALANFETVRAISGLSRLVCGKCVHGVHILSIDGKNPSPREPCDGLITEEPDTGLMFSHADCQIAIFFDPACQRIACIHAGWRGEVKNIYSHAIERMKALGSLASDLLVCISPSLGPDCSEFKNYEVEIPKELWTFQFRPLFFDLWAMARHQLLEKGILPHHIEIANICTFQQEKDFFSYRRDKITGRNATLVGLMRNS